MDDDATRREWEEIRDEVLAPTEPAAGGPLNAPEPAIVEEAGSAEPGILSKLWSLLDSRGTGEKAGTLTRNVSREALNANAMSDEAADRVRAFGGSLPSGMSEQDLRNVGQGDRGAVRSGSAEAAGAFTAAVVAGVIELAKEYGLGKTTEKVTEVVTGAGTRLKRIFKRPAPAELDAAESVASGSASPGFTPLARDARRYLRDIERTTGVATHSAQRARLAEALRTQSFEKLSAQAARKHRAAFNRVRSNLIVEWEQQTGQQWPKYTADVVSRRGVVLRRAGQRHDAHHIIESGYSGPNEWWNIHPAEFPGGHQGGVHRSAGASRGIFR